ncbi:hypothetical protein CHIBITOTORO_00380 [Serratia phage vB_SmaM-ChibiTotoro]|nr:hypothetical protein CHIBITOTORO_00380 [Serratia phage vB_SmaM-ChibiTotoro]
MKQKIKVHVQYYLTTGEWVKNNDSRAHKAGELGISLDGSLNTDIDYRRWFGSNINVGVREIEIDIPDDELLPLVKEQTEKAEGDLRDQLKRLEARFYMQKQILENQLEQMLMLTDKREVITEDVANFIPAGPDSNNGDDTDMAAKDNDAEEAEFTEIDTDDDADDGLPF